MKHDAKLFLSFRKIFLANGLDLQDLDDCIQEYVLSRLEQKNEKQSYRFFVLDYFIKRKKLISSKRYKRGEKATQEARFGPLIETFGKNDKRDLFDLELLYNHIQKRLSRRKKIILMLHLQGLSLVQIGEIFNLTSPRIAQHLAEIRFMLKRSYKRGLH